MHAGERVDERGLAGVGAAGESDLGEIGGRQLLELGDAQQKSRRPREQQPSAL
jgi:hypothetical protein